MSSHGSHIRLEYTMDNASRLPNLRLLSQIAPRRPKLIMTAFFAICSSRDRNVPPCGGYLY